MNNNTVTITTRDLSIGYPSHTVAKDIDITLRGGEVTAMLGENGAGKSTLIRTLIGDLPPLDGKIELLGRPLASYSRRQMATIASLVTTESVDAFRITVNELVALGRHPHTGIFGRLCKNDRDAVADAIYSVGIQHKAESTLDRLSDGERQKAMIARAIAQDTPIILLDEPFSFLDVASRIEILDLLKELAERRGTTVLFSTHDVSQAIRMADNIILFTPANGITQASPEELIADGKISTLFPGRSVVFDSAQNDFISVKKH